MKKENSSMKHQRSCAQWIEMLAISHPEKDLSPSEYAALEKHIAQCPSCAAIREQYTFVTTRLRTLSAAKPLPNDAPELVRLREVLDARTRSSLSLWSHRKYPSISVVIPARNEAQNLPYILPLIPSMVSEVILVDGHSTDDTIAVAQQLLPTIRIFRQAGSGIGDALRVGFAACTGEIIVMLNADGSADPREIPHFVEALMAGNDFAKGSRFIKDGGSSDITLLRRLGVYALSKLVNMLFRAQFTDLCYSYNAFRRHCLDYVEIDGDGFEVEALISISVHKAHLNIIEVPSFKHSRIYGRHNRRTFRDGWRVLSTILREHCKKTSTSVHTEQPHQMLLNYATEEEETAGGVGENGFYKSLQPPKR